MTSRDTILKGMRSHTYHPMRLRRLARFFDVAEDDYAEFRALVKRLIREGEIHEVRGKLRVPRRKRPRKKGDRTVEGRFSLSQRGFGFVEPEDDDADPDGPTQGDDLFIPPGQTLDAVTGDTVLAEVDGKGDKGYYGRILEVKERGHERFVGTVLTEDGRTIVRPDGGVLLRDFDVPDATSAGARPKDKVVFEVLSYGLKGEPGQAVITEVLGHRGDAGVDTLAVIRQFDLPDEFPEPVLAEAGRAAQRIDDDALQGRRDLTAETVITIDPEDARDYDDAISLQTRDDGAVTLGVHIADVAHFVPVGSALDREAYERGTSVYLPTTVLPMLPPTLSNGACSLQEGRTRLTKSVFITFDSDGEPGRVDITNAYIQSAKRLTYRQAQAAIEGKTDGLSPEVAALLDAMNRLARTLLDRRRRLGYLELDLPEVDLEFDDDGRVVDAHPEDTSFTHRIIEMFMVEANEAVARELESAGVPCMRRIHPKPDAEASEELQHYATSVGHRLSDPTDRHDLQALLNRVRGTPEAYGVHLAVLRSLRKAEYRMEPEGHFALGSAAYCHFTSPIRRYPDLTVHRAVDALVRGRGTSGKGRRRGDRKGAKPTLAEAPMDEAAAHCSNTERRAEAAERELTKIKLLEYLQSRVGDTFTGVITGVQAFGVFVENPDLLIDGLVHISSLADDYYTFDREKWRLVGRRSGRVLRVGTELQVRIAAVDIPRRQLDLVPVEAERKRKGGKKDSGSGGEKGKSKGRKQGAGKAKRKGSKKGKSKSKGKSKAKGGKKKGRKGKKRR